jgi:Ca2+/H+ antiporter
VQSPSFINRPQLTGLVNQLLVYAVRTSCECSWASLIRSLLSVQLGGLRYFEQGFDKSKAQVNCSLLMLGATTQILPGVMKFTTSNVSDLDPYSGVPFGVKSIARMSRAIAILLFLL